MNKEAQYKRLCIALGVFAAICVIVITVMLILWPRDTQDASAGTEDPSAGVTTTVDRSGETDATLPADAQEASPTTVDDTEDAPLTATNAVVIDTPYGTLYYPKTWSSYVKYSGETSGDTYAESFYCCIKEQEIPLFTIYFNAADKGFEAGSVSKDGQAVPVTVELHEWEPDETWTEDETTTLYAMQESVNEVLAALPMV